MRLLGIVAAITIALAGGGAALAQHGDHHGGGGNGGNGGTTTCSNPTSTMRCDTTKCPGYVPSNGSCDMSKCCAAMMEGRMHDMSDADMDRMMRDHHARESDHSMQEMGCGDSHGARSMKCCSRGESNRVPSRSKSTRTPNLW